MKAKPGILDIALAAAFALALAVTACRTGGRTNHSCGELRPHVSLLLWPKGYEAYPSPTFEVFRGRSGPYADQANILAYGSAAKDGALGYPAASVQSDCLDYGARARSRRQRSGRSRPLRCGSRALFRKHPS